MLNMQWGPQWNIDYERFFLLYVDAHYQIACIHTFCKLDSYPYSHWLFEDLLVKFIVWGPPFYDRETMLLWAGGGGGYKFLSNVFITEVIPFLLSNRIYDISFSDSGVSNKVIMVPFFEDENLVYVHKKNSKCGLSTSDQ